MISIINAAGGKWVGVSEWGWMEDGWMMRKASDGEEGGGVSRTVHGSPRYRQQLMSTYLRHGG